MMTANDGLKQELIEQFGTPCAVIDLDIVDRNIKAASSDKDGADFKELTYELYGHGGVGFVINALSDNSNRAYTDVGTVAKKANLKLAESGSVLHNFEKKGRLAVNSALEEDDLIALMRPARFTPP